MRPRRVIALGLVCGVFLVPSWTAAAQAGRAQEKKAAAKEERLHGTIRLLDKKTQSFTMELRSRPLFERKVTYNDSTRFTYRNKPATGDDLKEGVRVIVLGVWDSDKKNQMIAGRIDIREKP